MPNINNPEIIRKQYGDTSKLDIRIALHQRYSTNQQPFGDWIMEHYHIQPGMRVLELGCGTGNMWKQADRWLPQDAMLTLTDFSEGMVEADPFKLQNMDLFREYVKESGIKVSCCGQEMKELQGLEDRGGDSKL